MAESIQTQLKGFGVYLKEGLLESTILPLRSIYRSMLTNLYLDMTAVT